MQVGDTLIEDPLYSGMQAGYTQQVQGPALQAVGIFVQVGLLCRAYSCAAKPGMPYLNPFHHIRTTNPGWAHQTFVPGKTKSIYTHPLHVHLDSSGTLTTINHKQDSGLLADFANLSNRLNRTYNI